MTDMTSLYVIYVSTFVGFTSNSATIRYLCVVFAIKHLLAT